MSFWPSTAVLELASTSFLFISTSFMMSAILQGNAPNKFSQFVTHVCQGFYLSSLIQSFIAPNFPLIQNAYLLFGFSAITYGLPIGLYALELGLSNLYPENNNRTKLFTKLQRAHSYALNFGYLLTMGLAISVLPLVSALSITGAMATAIVSEKGLLPPPWSDRLRLMTYALTTLVLFGLGSYALGAISGLGLMIMCHGAIGKVFEWGFKHLFKFSMDVANYIKPNNTFSRKLSEILDRSMPDAKPEFKYKGRARDLYRNIQNLHQNPQLKINKYAIHQQKDILPPPRDNVDDELFLRRFDDLDWESFHDQIKREIQADWSSEHLLALDIDDIEVCKAALKNAFRTYIRDIRTNQLPNTVYGTHQKAVRYLDNIVYLSNNIPQEQANDRLRSIYLKLAIEGGQSCPNGKIRTLEETYRNLSSDADVDLPPELRVRAVLQTERELFFQEIIHRFPLFLKHFGSLQDIHHYNLLISFYAPRLGLPQLAMQSDPSSQNAGFSCILSALSHIEKEYWTRTDATDFITEVQKAWMGSLTLSMNDYLTWFEGFVQKLDDVESEKDELMEQYELYPVPNQPLDPDRIALMLLDMGLLYLDNPDNALTPIPPAQVAPPEEGVSQNSSPSLQNTARVHLDAASRPNSRNSLR